MARTSPQTERLVDTIDFLVTAPHQPRTLTEIARQLGVDKATCLPMLTELTKLGWLVKSPDKKNYRLGPRLVAIGQAADEALDIVSISAQLRAELADELHCAVALISRSSDALVVTAITQPHSGRCGTLGMQSGDRLPFRPPLGGVLVAWSSPYTTEQWIAKASASVEHKEAYRRALMRIRDRGYGVEQFESEAVSMTQVVEERTLEAFGSRRMNLILGSLWDELQVEWLVEDVVAADTYHPVSISAPVFASGPDAQTAVCALDTGPAYGDAVDRIGRRVAEVGRAISSRAAGFHHPTSSGSRTPPS